MPKYEVIQYYTTSKIYIVDAENEQEACDKVSSGKVTVDTVTGSEFSDEIVNLIE